MPMNGYGQLQIMSVVSRDRIHDTWISLSLVLWHGTKCVGENSKGELKAAEEFMSVVSRDWDSLNLLHLDFFVTGIMAWY